MPELTLKLCGDVLLTVAGDRPAGPPLGAKALALLGFLAVEPGPHRRDQLTTLLWGEYPEERAKASLRQALTHLRDAVGEPLRADRSTVELEGSVRCDVNDFLRLAREDPWAAITIDVPRFLTNLPLRNSPTFEEWADAKRRELVSRYVRLLANCTRERMDGQQWRDATRVAARWSELEPLSDDPVAGLMEAQFLAGERDAALATHAQYIARLANDSSRTPGRPIRDLAVRISRAGTVAARPLRAPENWYGDGAAFTSSLAGRAHEWEALRRAWDGVASGTSGIVLIDGEAGSGKTRLAEDFLRWVTSHGGVVLRGRGYDAYAGAPFGAVIEVLRTAVDAPGVAGVDPEWLAEVARVLPELRRRFVGLPDTGLHAGGTDSWRLFEAIAQVIAAIAEDSPGAVFVDDLQGCDADSCGLLQFLVRRLVDAPVLWCSTFTVGSVDRDAPTARLSRALRGVRGALSLVLAPLDEEAVWQMIREMARVDGPTGARRLAARIHEVTAGNPFYVIELLKTLFARELLAVDAVSGGWIVRPSALSETSAEAFGPTVHDTIAERIECLSDDLRALLISIAVAGRGIRTDVLSHVHGISRLRAAALGDALVERHLVTDDQGLYRCAHPIIAHVVGTSLSASRRGEVHRALALALEIVQEREGSDSYVGAIARHAEKAGERAMAYRYSLRAIESSCARCVYEESLSWIGMASAMAATPEESAAVEALSARVRDLAGWREVPAIRARASVPIARMDEGDLDLPARS